VGDANGELLAFVIGSETTLLVGGLFAVGMLVGLPLAGMLVGLPLAGWVEALLERVFLAGAMVG
jgi:hypothetical protein